MTRNPGCHGLTFHFPRPYKRPIHDSYEYSTSQKHKVYHSLIVREQRAHDIQAPLDNFYLHGISPTVFESNATDVAGGSRRHSFI
jgi:hypothetical protein